MSCEILPFAVWGGWIHQVIAAFGKLLVSIQGLHLCNGKFWLLNLLPNPRKQVYLMVFCSRLMRCFKTEISFFVSSM
jgi:hypothetical protein